MPYIGKSPVGGGFHKLDALTASATATYALTLGSAAYFPETANQLLVSLNGVIQAPQDSFTVSGSNLVFDSALTASDSIDFVVALGDVLGVGSVTDGAITTAKIGNNAVTMDKLATSGTLPALDGSALTSLPAGNLKLIATQTKTAADHPASTPYYYMDIANCFTSDYNNYVIDYKCISTDADSRELCFALETAGVGLNANDQFSTETWTSARFDTSVKYYLTGTATEGIVFAADSNFCFAGANLVGTDASGYFEGSMLLRNVYSGVGFQYQNTHKMYHPTNYAEEGYGTSRNNAAVNARGIRFFMGANASNGSGSDARNTYGYLRVYGVIGT